MRKAAHVDSNQVDVVQALRAAGAMVQHLHQVGAGCPDLLVAYRGRTYLLEVKAAKGQLNDEQLAWHRSWRGGPLAVVRTPFEALQAIGAAR